MTTELLSNGHRDELASIQAAYEALQRRDGSAERRAWQWQCLAYGVLILCGLLTLGFFWLIYQKTQVRAFVQVVQVNDDGKVVNLGVPSEKAYTGTFAVSRYRPPTEAALLSNRLGLCVSAFDLSLQP